MNLHKKLSSVRNHIIINEINQVKYLVYALVMITVN